jgi:glycosyltransferase involved in cell wall biosynthesis
MDGTDRSVTLVTMDSLVPMGQQRYESSLQQALPMEAGRDWRLRARRIASLRSQARGSVRLPLNALVSCPKTLVMAVAEVAYGQARLVHRFDLRLPPRLGREVITVHDVAPIRFDDEGTLPRWAIPGARRSLGVICPSHFSADEVNKVLRVRRIWVVPNGIDQTIGEVAPMARDELTAVQIYGPFVLHAGGTTRRKNLEALAAAWRIVVGRCPEATLVLIGPPHPRREVLFGGVENVRYLGYVSSEVVQRLVRSAAAVIVPSLYEGFGFPALEAMAAGAPVVAADCGALPEVCGDAALLVPATVDGLADGMLEVLQDRSRADRLRERGRAHVSKYSWEGTARQTLAIYKEVIT